MVDTNAHSEVIISTGSDESTDISNLCVHITPADVTGMSRLLAPVAVVTVRGYLFQFAPWRRDQKARSPKCSLRISACVRSDAVGPPFADFTPVPLIWTGTRSECVFRASLHYMGFKVNGFELD